MYSGVVPTFKILPRVKKMIERITLKPTDKPLEVVLPRGSTIIPIKVKFRLFWNDAKLPTQGTEESVGYDLYAYIKTEDGRPSKKLIAPHTVQNVPTGIAMEPNTGYFATVCSRSGIAKQGLSVCNSPGVIDPDYRGEIRVLLHNGGYEYQTIHHEDRIAQLIFFPATYIEVVEAETLSETGRGEKGFGSTGGIGGNSTR
jgi:dUTP pyrophosphatase